jgi:hypothetical protein
MTARVPQLLVQHRIIGVHPGHVIQQFGVGNGTVANNKVFYIPFVVREPFILDKFAYWCSTASGNVDLGLYDIDGNKLVSTGSTACATNAQELDVTDYFVRPGRYYAACAFSSATVQITRISATNAALHRSMGWLDQAQSLPLPTTATFSAWDASQLCPVFGLVTKIPGT